MERDAKEVARRRRIQHLEEQKRHSWAGGEKVGGAKLTKHLDSHTIVDAPLSAGGRSFWMALQQ